MNKPSNSSLGTNPILSGFTRGVQTKFWKMRAMLCWVQKMCLQLLPFQGPLKKSLTLTNTRFLIWNHLLKLWKTICLSKTQLTRGRVNFQSLSVTKSAKFCTKLTKRLPKGNSKVWTLSSNFEVNFCVWWTDFSWVHLKFQGEFVTDEQFFCVGQMPCKYIWFCLSLAEKKWLSKRGGWINWKIGHDLSFHAKMPKIKVWEATLSHGSWKHEKVRVKSESRQARGRSHLSLLSVSFWICGRIDLWKANCCRPHSVLHHSPVKHRASRIATQTAQIWGSNSMTHKQSLTWALRMGRIPWTKNSTDWEIWVTSYLLGATLKPSIFESLRH